MNRSERLVWIAAALLVLVACSVWWALRTPTNSNTPIGEQAEVAAPVPPKSVATNEEPDPDRPGPKEIQPVGAASPDELYSLFSADANGRLVLSETTRLNIEKLHALNTPEDYVAKLKQLSNVLPAAAHAELLRLAGSYVEYIDSVHVTFPPDAEVETVGQAEAELKGLHELRLKHFGPNVTEAFYGQEERMNRRMIELMALEADPTIPLAEKAHRAQQLLSAEQNATETGR